MKDAILNFLWHVPGMQWLDAQAAKMAASMQKSRLEREAKLEEYWQRRRMELAKKGLEMLMTYMWKGGFTRYERRDFGLFWTKTGEKISGEFHIVVEWIDPLQDRQDTVQGSKEEKAE